MEQEMQEKCDHTITMDPPPAYQNPSNASKSFLITIVTITLVTLLVVSFGVFYILISGKSPAVVNNVTTSGDKPIVLSREVSFQLSDGVARHEQIIAEGNKLKIVNNNDDYTVVFDFDRDLAVFKNRTTSTCYFLRLNDIPVEMKMDNLSAIYPILFHEAFAQDDELPWDINGMVFRTLERIPTGYIEVTSGETCAVGLSFWIEPTEAKRVRNTRQISWTPSPFDPYP